MVTTRRKPIITYKEASDDEYDFEDPVTSGPSRMSGETDVEDEEYEKPRRKRQRSSTSSAKSKGKGKTKARELIKSLFDALPLDLVFEIFSHLRPIDLLQLARTNRLLRSCLMRKSSTFVWIAARQNESPSPPDCPHDQSEPQWAHLIYTRDCTICGQPRIQKMDWFLRIRGCERCLKSNIYTRIKAIKAFRDIEDVDAVLELLPYTNTGGWAHGHASNSKFYLKDSILEMAKILEEYQTDVDVGIEGAHAKLKAFIARKKEEAAAVVASAPEFKKWARETRVMKWHLDDHMKELRRSAMKAKLLALGHLEADIDVAKHRAKIFDSTAQLTETRWNAIRTKAEQAVNNAKIRRIEQERQALFATRRDVLGQAYHSFSASNYEGSKGLLPDAFHLVTLPLIDDLIKKDGEDPLSTDDFTPLLPEAIRQWVKTAKTDLLRNVMKEGGPSVSEPPTAAELDSLALAVTTFSCNNFSWRPRNEVVFIDDKIREHSCWTPWRHDCLKFDSWKSKVAAELVVLSNLDPASATQKDMDSTKARFLCGKCTGNASEVARNWRDCLEHISDHPYGSDALWTKVDEESMRMIHDIENATRNTFPESSGGSLLGLFS